MTKKFPTIERAGDYIDCAHCGKRLLTDVEPLRTDLRWHTKPDGKYRIQCHDSECAWPDGGRDAQGCGFWTYYDITPPNKDTQQWNY